MKRILITGANGFVGQALAAELLRNGHHVIAVVRRPGVAPDGSHETVIPDVAAADAWRRAHVGPLDAVIHLAARVHRMRDLAPDPMAEFRRVNLDGTARSAEFAAASGARRFVFLSTAKVLGESSGNDVFDDSRAAAPADPYAISKLEAELRLNEIAEKAKIETLILRPPLVYGPGVGGNFLALLRTVMIAPALPFAGVKNLRALLYVHNLTNAIVSWTLDESSTGGTYLVRDDEQLSTPELITLIATVLGRRVRLFSIPVELLKGAAYLLGQRSRMARLTESFRIDDSRFREMHAWSPPFSLDEGIRRTCSWYREIIAERQK